MPHVDRKANGHPDLRRNGEIPADELFVRRVREERERRDWSQRHLADLMTNAGLPMTHDRISKLELGEVPLRYIEAVFFAGELEVPFVLLASPLEGEEVRVRVDGWRYALGWKELRNWFVYGHRETPAAREAQHGMKWAHATYAFMRPRDDRQKADAESRISKLLRR